MEKFIPYEKLSKREQQKINKARRGTWGEINPVTRKPKNSKAYSRKRAQAWKKDLPDLRSAFSAPKASENSSINKYSAALPETAWYLLHERKYCFVIFHELRNISTRSPRACFH